MRNTFKYGIASVLLLGLLLSTGVGSFAARPVPQGITATASGKGTIKVGRESFQIHSVVVKLNDDGSAELTLVSDITFFISGRWTQSSNSPKTFALQITGSMTGGGAQGTGTIIMRPDGSSLDRLSAQGGIKTSQRKVNVDFVAN